MRTTLTIDDDVLYTAKEMARAQNRTTGAVISDMFRKAATLTDPLTTESTQLDQSLAEFGVHRFPRRGGVVTNDDVNRIREELNT